MIKAFGARFFLFIIFFLLLAGRLLHLSADPPLFYPNGWRAYEPFTDEAAKAYHSRNRLLFGNWNTSKEDQYRFWRVLSPVWCYALWVWFKGFGVNYSSLRLFSLFWFGWGLFLLYLIFVKTSLRSFWFYSAFFYLFNFYLFIFSRLGLMESMLNSFLLMAFAFLVLSLKKKCFFPLSLLFFFASYFVKQNALLVFPVFVVGYFLVFGRPWKKKFWQSGANWASIILALLMLVVLNHLWHQPEYRLFTIMNLRHGYGFPPDASRAGLVLRLDFIKDAIRYQMGMRGLWETFFGFDPLLGLMTLGEIIFIIYGFFRRNTLEKIEVLALVWLFSLRFFLVFSSARVERFWLPQIPPMVLLAGIGLCRIKNFFPKHSQILLWLILLLSFSWNFFFWSKWFFHPRYEIISAEKKLQQTLGEKPAVVIGKWAGPLLLPSHHQYYYVKNIFNRSQAQLRSFGINYLLLGEVPLLVRDKFELTEDPYLFSFEKSFPEAFAQKKLVCTIPFYDGELFLYQVSP